MIKQILLAFTALLLLAGCSSGSGSGMYGNYEGHIAEFQKSGDSVFFSLDSAALSQEAKSTLDRQAKWLMTHDKFTITVAGHCDERGTKEYNIALGERRAAAVKKYLVAQGVSAGSIETMSYGKERPAVVGHNEAAWAKNRRSVTSIR